MDVIKGISASPGVYLMKDAGGQIIYVGKAINLQKRVASYFQRQDALGLGRAVPAGTAGRAGAVPLSGRALRR